MDTLRRRDFVGALAAASFASSRLTAQETARHGTVPDQAPFEGPLSFTRANVAAKVEPFAMGQVRLLPGPFADAAEWNRGYLDRLSEDRLVRNFRENAGLATSATPLGGWEKNVPGNDGEVRGHLPDIIFPRAP